MFRSLIAVGALALMAVNVSADATTDLIESQIRKIDARIPINSIKPASIGNLYEVELGSGEVLYSDAEGEYFVLGQLYQLSDDKGFVNLTEQRANGQRKELLEAVAAEDKVTFPAQAPVKASVYVFTDVDCPYCQKLHQEVPKLQEMGIAVEYLAFPRQGAGSPAHQKMVSIWCADDKQSAMTASKARQTLENKTCDNPVLEQYALGQEVGVTGTPAIVTQEGQLIPGYVPAERLAAMLGVTAE